MSGGVFAVAVAAVTVVGAALRCLAWSQVFTPAGVRFLFDADTHYHVLRAERILLGAPGAPWFDSNLTYPSGATVPWPPLFDELIAWSARWITGPSVTRESVEAVAAVMPVVLGSLTVPIVALAAAAVWGRRGALVAAACVAVAPAHLEISTVGRPDHHVLELLVFTCLIATVAQAATHGFPVRRGVAWVATATTLAVAFWSWQGSGLYLVYLGLSAALWVVVGTCDRADAVTATRFLAVTSAAASLLLLATVALWGRSGALTSLTANSIGAFHVALVAGFAGAMSVAWTIQARGHGRVRSGLVALGAVAALVCGLLALLPQVRSAVVQVLAAFFLEHPVYSSIDELTPLLFSGFKPLWEEAAIAAGRFGPLLALPFLTVNEFRRQWRERPHGRVVLVLLATGCVLFYALTLHRARFGMYLLPFLAFSAALATGPAIPPRPRSRSIRVASLLVLTAAGLAWAVAGYASREKRPFGPLDEDLIVAFRTLGALQPATPSRPSVVGQWDYGHHVQYYAAKPVLATPFLEDLEPHGIREGIRFLFARDETTADAILTDARAGFILVGHPLAAYAYLEPLAPAGSGVGARRTKSLLNGESVEVSDAVFDLVTSRLFFFDGMLRPGAPGPAMGTFRLVYETRATNTVDGYDGYKFFGVVPGGRLLVFTGPLTRVDASIVVSTNQGRSFEWRTFTIADAEGTATVRIPYAAGWNGLVRASACTVSDGRSSKTVTMDERAVVEGGAVRVSLR